MKPRLREDWTTPPINTQGFVDKLRWFALNCTSCSPPHWTPKVRKLLKALLDLKLEKGTAYLSTQAEMTSLRQPDDHKPATAMLSLGCDEVVVLALKTNGEAKASPQAAQAQASESWKDLVAGFSDDDDEEESRPVKPTEAAQPQPFQAKDYKTTAIHLRVGDALVFTGESRRAWYGVAKVLPDTSRL